MKYIWFCLIAAIHFKSKPEHGWIYPHPPPVWLAKPRTPMIHTELDIWIWSYTPDSCVYDLINGFCCIFSLLVSRVCFVGGEMAFRLNISDSPTTVVLLKRAGAISTLHLIALDSHYIHNLLDVSDVESIFWTPNIQRFNQPLLISFFGYSHLFANWMLLCGNLMLHAFSIRFDMLETTSHARSYGIVAKVSRDTSKSRNAEKYVYDMGDLIWLHAYHIRANSYSPFLARRLLNIQLHPTISQ